MKDREYCLSNDGKICKPQKKAVTFSGAVIVYKVNSAIAKQGKYEAHFQ